METSHHKRSAVARGKKGYTSIVTQQQQGYLDISDCTVLFYSLCVQPGSCICQIDSNVGSDKPHSQALPAKVRIRVEPGNEAR